MTQPLESQHTATFSVFLAQTGIALAVSTYQAGKLILLRDNGGVLNTHFINMERPMGMASTARRLTIGSGVRVWDYYNLPAVAAKVEPLNRHDACYLPRRQHVTGDIDIHEMAYSDNDELWLVNTKMSCLCTLNLEYSVVPCWRPPFVSQYDLTDRCYLNGLAMKDGQPGFVTALGKSDQPGGWRKDKAFGGFLMALKPERLIADQLSMPHSPRWYRDSLWVLESGAGTLAKIGPNIGKKEVIAELPEFTRGLDFVGDFAVIGLSQVRETAVFAGLPLTQRCAERHCGVWIADIRRRQVVGYVIFSGDVQEIFSVQVLPSRYPAILEHDDPLLRVSYSLPDEALKHFAKVDPLLAELEEATLMHQNGQYPEAIARYKTLLDQSPENVLTGYRLGVALADAERWQEAIDTLARVVEKDPKNA